MTGARRRAAIRFEVDAVPQAGLLTGQDEIETDAGDGCATIEAFEARRRVEMPWLTPGGA